MATNVDTLKYTIDGNTSKYNAAIDKSRGKTKTFDVAVVRLGRGMSSLIPIAGGLAGTAALGGVVAVMAQGVKSMAEWERRTLRTESLIRATGNAAGLTAEQLAAFASELDLSTLGNRDNILDAINAMQTFKSVSRDVFKDSIRLALDLSEVMGTDVSNQAMQLGKALEDPTTGLTALRRVGVSFTDSQKDLIKSLEETGQKAEAQRVILKALEEQVGGAAEGAAGGVAGKMDTASFQTRAFKENLAQLGPVVTTVNGLLDSFNKTMASINDVMSQDPLVQLDRKIEDLQHKIQMSSGGGFFEFANKRIARLNKELADLMMERGEIIASGAIVAPQAGDMMPGSDGNGAGLDSYTHEPPDYTSHVEAHQAWLDEKDNREVESILFRMELEEAEWQRNQNKMTQQIETERSQAEQLGQIEYEAHQNSLRLIEEKKRKDEIAKQTAVNRGKWALQQMGKDSETAFKAYQALAITEATISGIVATIEAFRDGMQSGGYYTAIAYAASSALYTAAQIAAIGGQGGGADTPSTPTHSASPDTGMPNVDPAISTEQRGTLHIHFDGPVYGDEEFANYIVEKVNEAGDRDVFIEYSQQTVS